MTEAASPAARHPTSALRVDVFPDAVAASRDVAAGLAREVAGATAAHPLVLGLATGATPQGVYAELVRCHREQGLSFRHVITVNLDEYWPLAAGDPRAFRHAMDEALFRHVDLSPDRILIPDGTVPAGELARHAEAYEAAIAAAGGVGHQLLGIGANGHLAFNEPGSPHDGRTGLSTLHQATLADAPDGVPQSGITMGLGTILEARTITLLAFGEHKAEAVAAALKGSVSEDVPATALRGHASVRVVLDEGAAGELGLGGGCREVPDEIGGSEGKEARRLHVKRA